MGNLVNNDGISSIYNNYNPAFKNLYRVEISCPADTSQTKGIEDYIMLHATSVSFGGETLTLQRNEVTKNFQLGDGEAYKRVDNLTITWRENDMWKVKKYHENWMEKFYDKDKDHYISYADEAKASALYRKIKVYIPYRQSNGQMNWDNGIVFDNVLPNTNGGMDLSWGTGSEVVSHSMTYYVKKYHWSSDKYYRSDKMSSEG